LQIAVFCITEHPSLLLLFWLKPPSLMIHLLADFIVGFTGCHAESASGPLR
jgi:hypothetical protein